MASDIIFLDCFSECYCQTELKNSMTILSQLKMNHHDKTQLHSAYRNIRIDSPKSVNRICMCMTKKGKGMSHIRSARLGSFCQRGHLSQAIGIVRQDGQLLSSSLLSPQCFQLVPVCCWVHNEGSCNHWFQVGLESWIL